MSELFQALAAQFPPTDAAREDGLLCAGGDLQPARLLVAYSLGIFPWYEENVPILWWSPDPRCVLPLEAFCLPRRSARALRSRSYCLSLDTAFAEVVSACAAPRPGLSELSGVPDVSGATESRGTWITAAMQAAYQRLHALGYAHSVEVRCDGELVGGLYGVALGRAFFGESMFHRASEASRAALAGLVELLRLRKATLLDCQQETPHIMRMGGRMLRRADFSAALRAALDPPEQSCGTAAVSEAALALCPWQPWETGYVHAKDRGWTPVPRHPAA